MVNCGLGTTKNQLPLFIVMMLISEKNINHLFLIIESGDENAIAKLLKDEIDKLP